MPVEKSTTFDHSMESGDTCNDITSKASSASPTVHSTDIKAGGGDGRFAYHCSDSDGNEHESNQPWTHVGRSFNSRQAQKKKMKSSLQNDHDSYRYTSNRGRDSLPSQRASINGEFNSSSIPQNISDSSYRTKADKNWSVHDPKSALSLTADSTASTTSSPAPSVSSDMHNGTELCDHKTFSRHSHKSYRSYKSIGPKIEADDSNDRRRNASPVCNHVKPNTRPPVNRVTTGSSASNNHQNDQSRRSNNGTFRRQNHTLNIPRNQNQFYRYNASGFHPNRSSHMNTFSRSRDSQCASHTNESTAHTTVSGGGATNGFNITGSPPTAKSDQSHSQTHRTTWAAAVASKPNNIDSVQTHLVNFLLEQWQCFQHKPQFK